MGMSGACSCCLPCLKHTRVLQHFGTAPAASLGAPLPAASTAAAGWCLAFLPVRRWRRRGPCHPRCCAVAAKGAGCEICPGDLAGGSLGGSGAGTGQVLPPSCFS